MIFAIAIDGRKYEVRSTTLAQAVKLALEEDVPVAGADLGPGLKVNLTVEVHKAPAVRKIG